MIEGSNITNQLPVRGNNSAHTDNSTVIAKSNKNNNGNIGDFISIIMQNIQSGLQTNKVNANSEKINNIDNNDIKTKLLAKINSSPELQQQLQKLLQLSPDELNDLLQNFASNNEFTGLNGELGINDIISLLKDIKVTEDKTGQLPANKKIAVNKNDNQLLTQLMGQKATANTATPIATEETVSNTPLNQLASKKDIANAKGVTTGKNNILSFNNDDILLSFSTEKTEKQLREFVQKGNLNNANVTNKNNNQNNNSQIATALSNIVNSNKQNNTQVNAIKIASNLGQNLNANPDTIVQTKPQDFANNTILQNINNNNFTSDITLDSQVQGRPVTAQNFASYTTAKAGQAFQSHSTQQVYINIQKNAAAKIEQMTLQLEPADLGKIEINLKFAKDGVMKAHLVLEKKETLGMLQRDANALENTLKDAGIELEDNSLSFDMASGDDHFEQAQEQQQNGAEFSLDMLLNNPANTVNITAGNASIASNTNYIKPDGVNILI